MTKLLCLTLRCVAYRLDVIKKLTRTVDQLLLVALERSLTAVARVKALVDGRQRCLVEVVNPMVDVLDCSVTLPVTRGQFSARQKEGKQFKK